VSVCPSAWNNSASTGRIVMKFYISGFFENLSRKFKFHSNLTRITGTLHEGQNTFMTISRFILHRTRHVSDKSCRENQNMHFGFNTLFPKIVSFMRKCGNFGRARQCTDGNIIRRMRFACWTTITKATDTHSEYVTLIAFPLQQCLRKRSSILCYTYITCRVSYPS
jgi:hypothetical protein